MKHWLGLAALICFGSATAQAEDAFKNVLSSSDTIITVSISSVTATPLFTPTLSGASTGFWLIMGSRKVLEVQNLDISSYTWVSCLPQAVALNQVSTTTLSMSTFAPAVSSSLGKAIWPQGGKWSPNLEASDGKGNYFVPYCLSIGGNKSVNVGVEQGASY